MLNERKCPLGSPSTISSRNYRTISLGLKVLRLERGMDSRHKVWDGGEEEKTGSNDALP